MLLLYFPPIHTKRSLKLMSSPSSEGRLHGKRIEDTAFVIQEQFFK